MLPINPADLVPLPLDGTSYFIKVPSHIEHGHWLSDIEAQNVVQVQPEAMAARAAQLVRDYCPADSQPLLLALLDAEMARLGARDDAPMAAEFEALHQTLTEIDPKYARDATMARRWLRIAPLCAAFRFLRGWEGDGLPVPKLLPNGQIAPAQIEALPREHVAAVGWKAIDLMTLSPSAEKNSQPPSSSRKSRTPSREAKPVQTAAAG